MIVEVKLIALTDSGDEIGIYQVIAPNSLEYLEKTYQDYKEKFIEEYYDSFEHYLETIEEINIKRLDIEDLIL